MDRLSDLTPALDDAASSDPLIPLRLVGLRGANHRSDLRIGQKGSNMRILVGVALLVAVGALGCANNSSDACLEGADERGWAPPFGRALWCENDNGELNGRQMLWYRQGHLLVSANFRGGRLHGRLLHRSRLGWRRREVHFSEGELDGRVVRWLGKDRKVFEGHYQAGQRDGSWATWYQSGEPRSMDHYLAGRLDGEHREWSESGVVLVEGTYQLGRPLGRWIWRDPDGKTRRTISYAWSAVITNYQDGAKTGRTTLSDPEAIARAEND